jgi:hypothetical protein
MLVQLNLRPEPRQLRQFGWIALVGFGLLGSVLIWKGGLFGASFGSAARPVAQRAGRSGRYLRCCRSSGPRATGRSFVGLGVLTLSSMGAQPRRSRGLVLRLLTPSAFCFASCRATRWSGHFDRK